MTPAQFRKIALALPGAEERSHMNHPDFRVGGKIFATLSAAGKESGMVSLTPEEQRDFVKRGPDTFEPVKGGWGAQGATLVKLKTADPEILGEALTAAWRRRSAKPTPNRRG